jgi:hypothetical protein
MKRTAVFIALIAFVLTAALALGASPVVKVRVVDVGVYGMDNLTDAKGISDAATMSIAENPAMFPPISSLVATVGKESVKYVPDVTIPAGALKVDGSTTEAEKLTFASIPNPDRAGKFDMAVVSRDGTVTYVDDEVVIDYVKHSISMAKPIAVKDGDVVLLFAKAVETSTLGDDKTKTPHYNQEGHTPGTLDHQNPTHQG